MTIDITSTANLGHIAPGDKVSVDYSFQPSLFSGEKIISPVFTVTKIRKNQYNERIWMADLEYKGEECGCAALAACTLVEDSPLNVKELVWE